jgi:NADPH-ferrihemoprotein reductase
MMYSSVIDLESTSRLLLIYSRPLYPKTVGDIAALILITALTTIYLLRGTLWDKPDPYQYIYFQRPQQNGSLSSAPKATRNIAEKLTEADKDCVIFWGSQSGTAEALAGRLAKECQLRYGLKSLAADLSDYDAETITQISTSKLVIFVLSTYGEGDPSDNAAGLWDWVTKSENASLRGVKYAAFGLGNSNYKYYNRVVDVVAERLDHWGAQKLLRVGKADDAARSTQEDFMMWKDELFAVFRTIMGFGEQSIEYQPALSAIEDESLEPIDLYQGEPAVDGKSNSKNSAIKALAIKTSREIFQGGSRNCVHMELDISDQPQLNYKTGDHLAVWPINPEAEVELLLQTLGRQDRADIPILLKSLDPDVGLKVPAPATLSTLLRSYLETCAPVSRDAILGLIQFAPNAEARAVVTKLSQDREYYQQYISHTQLTLGRLLQLASPAQAWTNLPLSWVIETLPALQPRYYSISSSSVLSPRRIAITALVAADSLPATVPNSNTMPGKINGVTSNYIHALSARSNGTQPVRYALPSTENDITAPRKLYAHIRKSKFKLPTSKATPIIMVAAGTGLAPFRAFVAERAKLAANGTVGAMRLFFGCRHPEEDYIYRDELEATEAKLCADQEGLFKIVTAFSRMAGQEKKYVQDRVAEEGEEVVRLLEEEGASLYVCGRTVMAKEVGRQVVQAAVRWKGWDTSRAEEWVEGLKRMGKWREDVWG